MPLTDPNRCASKSRRGERGTAIVETAIVFPLFGLLLFGVIQFGLILANYITIRSASA